MKPLIANLKTLYQCRYIWIFQFILIIGISIMVAINYKFAPADFPPMAVSLLLTFIYGEGIGFMVAGILSKPFGFCLPGQMKTVQKMIFLIWLLITIIYFLVMVVLIFMGIKSDYAFFVGSIGLMSLSYWLGVTIIIPKGRFISILILYLLIFTIGYSIITEIKFVESILLAHPWSVAFLCGTLSYLIYRAVGCRGNVRSLCAMPWRGLSAFSEMKQNKLKRERMRMIQDQRLDRATDVVSCFLIKHVRSNHNSMFLAHLWGQVYRIIGPFIGYWRAILLSSLLLSIVVSLVSPIEGTDLFIIELIIFILASVFCSIICDYHRFDIFLLIGRREHFRRGIIVMFTAILISLGLMAASVFLFNLLSGSLLPLMFVEKSFILPIRWMLLIVPILMIPLFGGLFILFKKTMRMIALTAMLVIAVAASLFAVFAMENMSFIIDLLIVLSAAAITWGFHITVLYYDSMKRSLC